MTGGPDDDMRKGEGRAEALKSWKFKEVKKNDSFIILKCLVHIV